MTFSPPLSLFEHTFFGIADVAFLVTYIIAARIIRGTKWGVHLRWLIPCIIGSGLALAYRTIWNVHFFTGIHLPRAAYAFGLSLLYIANGADLWGAVVLCRVMKELVAGGLVERPGQPERLLVEQAVWPPPPKPPV